MMRCQMTTDDAREQPAWVTYSKCNKPAKYRVPEVKMSIEFICGIHAKSLDKMYERTGSKLRCIPLSTQEVGG